MTAALDGTRQRILGTTATLLRRQGYAATGLKEIATESASQIGSIYHFFGNKETLAAEAIRTSGEFYGAMVLGVLQHGPADPAEAIEAAFAQAATDLADTDYADACPIATVALEVASTNETLRAATADVFADWTAALTEWCATFVDDRERASQLAVAILASLEGAFILARAQRTPEPLHAAGRAMSVLADAF